MDTANPAEEIIEMLEKIEAGIEQIGQVLSATLSFLPEILEWVIDAVEQAWNALMAKLAEFWAWFTDVLSYIGNPGALFDSAASWRNDVGAVASNIGFDINDNALQVDDAWQGLAATRYRQAVAAQREALTSLADDFAANIANGLDALGAALIVFYVAVAGVIVSIVLAIVLALTAAASIVGAPASPIPVLAALVGAIVSLIAARVALQAGVNGAKGDFDKAGFGIDSWPDFITS